MTLSIFFDLSRDCSIRLADISSIEIVGNSPTGFSNAFRQRVALRVVMQNGTEHTIEHGSGSMGEVDAFKVHRELKRALATSCSEG